MALNTNLSSAQRYQSRDFDGWGWVGVHVPIDSSTWSADGIYRYRTYQNWSRTASHFGTIYVTYNFPRRGFSLTPLYAIGDMDQTGRVQVLQVRLLQTLPRWQLRPRWRLTLDQIWFASFGADGQRVPDLHRVRVMVGIEPRLSDELTLILNTEPFVYRSNFWFRENRTQVGGRLRVWQHLDIGLIYLNRWTGFPSARVTWEHFLILNTAFRLGNKRKSTTQPP